MISGDPHSADCERPWIGLASFKEADAEFFAGRREEAEELLRLVRRDTLTLLYGVSGLGKTSLLQAGLFPPLRRENFLPVPIRLDYLEGSGPLVSQVHSAIAKAASAAGVESPEPRPGDTLWEYFHRVGNLFWSPRLEPITPVLIFDQFEEIFTLGREDAGRTERGNAFIEEFADLVENRPPAALRDDPARVAEFDFKPVRLKVLLGMREDYLAELDQLRARFRDLGQNRLRLLPMGERQARAVIALGASLIESGLENRLLKFIAGGGGATEAMTIAPALLSLVMRELNERRLARGSKTKITADLFKISQTKILEDFYLRSLEGFPAAVGTFIEDALLTAGGFRNSCALDDALAREGLTEPILNELVNRRLLAYEDRHHTRRIELAHDILVPVLKASRATRRSREERERAETNAAEVRAKLRHSQRLSIAFAALGICAFLTAGLAVWKCQEARVAKEEAQTAQKKAQTEEKKARAEKLTAEEARIKAEEATIRAQKAEELARSATNETKEALEKAKVAKADAESAATIADQERVKATKQKAAAEDSRTAADQLITSLNVSLRDKLVGSGRSDLLEHSNQLVAAHYKAHPPTDRVGKRGFATNLDNQGDALCLKHKYDEATGYYQHALQIRQQLIDEQNDPEVARDLLDSYYRLGAVYAMKRQNKTATDWFGQGVKVAKRLAAAAPKNPRLQYELGSAYSALAWSRSDEATGEAIKLLELAVPVLKPVASGSETTWKREYARCLYRLASLRAKPSLERIATSLDVLHQLEKEDPNNALWQTDIAESEMVQGDCLREAKEPKKAKAAYANARTVAQKLVIIDGANHAYKDLLDRAVSKERE